MSKTSIYDIKTELEIFLRNSDVLTISERGVTTSQDTGTFTAAATHTLAVNPTLAKNVRNVKVDGNDLIFGVQYSVNYSSGVITFVLAQTGAYIIDYDQGSKDAIYFDFPQAYLKLNDFPRIGFDIISGATSEFGIGAETSQSEYIISIVCYFETSDDAEKAIAKMRGLLLDNKKNFYYIPFLTVTNMGPLLVTPFGQNKIFQRNQDIMVKFVFEQ